jgi:chemotaxis protein MotA
MITMMSSLAGDAQKTVGPSMAIALVATFWGISISNFILLPLSDYALKLAAADVRTRRLILEGAVQIRMKTPPLVLIELINGHLSVDERLSFKSKIKNECELMERKSA